MDTRPYSISNDAPPHSDRALIDSLHTCVREAGALALSFFGQAPRSQTKADGTSVSDADLAVDDYLRKHLGNIDPAYGWLSEETEDDPSRLECERVWVVDPIDGTRAFLKERPEWTVCAALVENGEPLLAAVFNPAKNEFFHATRGEGAFLNDTAIMVPDPVSLQNCRLAASATMFRPERWPEPWPEMETVWVNSIAYRLALVAAGKCDGTVSMSGKCDWDIAAADLIVREAGGAVTTHDARTFTYNHPNSRHSSVVAAGPALHAQLIARTSKATI